MTSLQAIEAAVEQLDPAGRASFRAWFERFDAADWDQQLENDVEAGTRWIGWRTKHWPT
jgi:hypothetical protein